MASAVSCPFSRPSIRTDPSIRRRPQPLVGAEQKATVVCLAFTGCRTWTCFSFSSESDFPPRSSRNTYGENALRECNDAREVRMRTNCRDHRSSVGLASPLLFSLVCVSPLNFPLQPTTQKSQPLVSAAQGECLGSAMMQSNFASAIHLYQISPSSSSSSSFSIFGISRMVSYLRQGTVC